MDFSPMARSVEDFDLLCAERDRLAAELADMTRSHEIIDRRNDKLAAQVAALQGKRHHTSTEDATAPTAGEGGTR